MSEEDSTFPAGEDPAPGWNVYQGLDVPPVPPRPTGLLPDTAPTPRKAAGGRTHQGRGAKKAARVAQALKQTPSATEHDIALGEKILRAGLGDIGNSRNRFGGIVAKQQVDDLANASGEGQNLAETAGENPTAAKNFTPPATKKPREFFFQVNNPWAWKPGQSGNPTGRPKLMKKAYSDILAATDEYDVTNADKIALGMAYLAIEKLDVQAAREIRQATEGDTVNVGNLADIELDGEIKALMAKLEALEGAQRGLKPAVVIENQPKEPVDGEEQI